MYTDTDVQSSHETRKHRITEVLINHAFKKPLPHFAFDHEPINRAVRHRHIPFIAVPGLDCRVHSFPRARRVPPVARRAPRTGGLDDGAARKSLAIGLTRTGRPSATLTRVGMGNLKRRKADFNDADATMSISISDR